jgi:predicted metal-dependent phosphoesterase TrpH
MVLDIEQILDYNYSKGYADLHLHTIYSDGEYTPEGLVQKALAEKFRVIAVTDHDTVEGVAPVLEKAGDSIEIIPGVELSSEVGSLEELHIVGLFIDYKDPALLKILKGLSLGRKDRMDEMLKKLSEMGMPVTMEEVEKFKTKDVIGRLHLAQAMVMKGYVKNTNEAFDKFLGDDKPAYAGRKRLSSQDAISLIKKVGGIPILAHPHLLRDESVIPQLVEEGIEGIEVYYVDHGRSPSSKFIEIARKYDLLISGGSDCHGLSKGKTFLGKVKIPYQVVEEMKRWKEKRGMKDERR